MHLGGSSPLSDIIAYLYNNNSIFKFYKRGYSIIGNTLILHIIILGSSPSFSKAREAQLVEQNIEAIWVVSSSLISGNRRAGIGRQVPFRRVFFASSSLVVYTRV